MISPVYDEWTTYVGVVMKSEIHGIELVARMGSRNDIATKVLDRRLCPKRLMSSALNVASCLLNHHKKLRTILMSSPHSLSIMKQC
jgi:hypothetical protein